MICLFCFFCFPPFPFFLFSFFFFFRRALTSSYGMKNEEGNKAGRWRYISLSFPEGRTYDYRPSAEKDSETGGSHRIYPFVPLAR